MSFNRDQLHRMRSAGSRLVQSLSIALAFCAAAQLQATDYVVSGEQTVYNIDGARTSALMSVSFKLTKVATNWAITVIYTNTGAIDTIALVGGCTYSCTADLTGKSVGAGLVMDKLSDRLEGATIFPRVLVMAFLTPRQRLETATNMPVPFLHPRHAGSYCYKWTLGWSAAEPQLLERVRFDLDPALVRQVPADAIHYYFRSGYRDRSLFRAFAASQRRGAEYTVTAWTNWNGETLPLRSAFRFTTFDTINNGVVVPQLLVTTLTNIAQAGSASLIPALAPGDGLQHIFNGTCYYYTSPDGGFLSHERARAVGRVLKPAPPLPRSWAAVAWLRSAPWLSIGEILFIPLVVLTLVGLVWLLARFLLSKK